MRNRTNQQHMRRQIVPMLQVMSLVLYLISQNITCVSPTFCVILRPDVLTLNHCIVGREATHVHQFKEPRNDY